MKFYAGRTRLFALSIVFLTISALFVSCGRPATPRITIGNDFYYWESTAESNPGDVMRNMHNFRKLEDKSEHNLMRTFGKGKHYVWIKADFEIPPQFKNQPLGMVIPHLRFAEQVWCNGTFISQYGVFPPHEQSTLFKAHFFSFPLNVLNQDGKNTVLIKVFIQADSGISSHAFIQPTRFAYPAFEHLNFMNSRIYMLLFGIMFFTFILYFSLYANLKMFKEFREFALLNLFSCFCLFYFFATEVPLYTAGHIPFLIFAKFTLCIPGYTIVYLSTLFAADYCGTKTPFPLKLARNLIFAVQVIPTFFATSYDFLVRVSPFMMVLVAIQVAGGICELVMNFLNKEAHGRALQFLIGFLPFLLGIMTDVTVRLIDNTQAYPYFTIFGWQGTIVILIAMLSIRFSNLYRSNIQLTEHLQEEVAMRTHDLQDANYELSLLNERLEKDKRHSEMDLEMASVVQRNFFPHPNKQFRGWEIGVCYSPAAKVSGDFYDYYNYNDNLNGISLFDVSGHGLSASLVTMLSKNIISRVFQTGFRRKESIDRVLNKINNMILAEKGDIDNYMTGILCRFDDEADGKCRVELGNAGHPYPFMYSLAEDKVYELKGDDGNPHYGAIGMKAITVSFARSKLLMDKGDILFLFTDGISEASNPRQAQFGSERIKEILKENHDKSSADIISSVVKALEAFTEGKPIDDDVTLIVAKRIDAKDFVGEEEVYENDDDIIEELDEV